MCIYNYNEHKRGNSSKKVKQVLGVLGIGHSSGAETRTLDQHPQC